jgi:SulP family sulfate permease
MSAREPRSLRGAVQYLTSPIELFRGYRLADLSPDLVAGATVAAVAIPQAIAYASIAELPPQYGLYTAVVAAVIGSLWGSSRHLATGPVNAVSLLVLPVLLAVAEPGSPLFLVAASFVALMVGVLDIGLALLRFGAVVTLASRSVLLGFTAGAAIHIGVGQLKHLLRLEVITTPELYRTVLAITAQLESTHLISLGLGLATLIALILLQRLGPRVPAALIAVFAAAVLVAGFGLEDRGVRAVGAIPRSLPPFSFTSIAQLPDFHTIRALSVGALAVAALGLVEAVASAQTLAKRSGDRIDANQEFFGQGLANIAVGLFSGYPCSGSFTRSSLSYQVGARTRMAGIMTGVIILVGMLALAPYARFIPRSAIAAVLLVVAWSMIDREGTRRALMTSRSEAAVMGITFVATLTLPLDFAVLAGILFALAFFVIRSSLPRVYPVVPDDTFRHLVHAPDKPDCPQLGIMNIRGPLFFGAVYHVEEELRHNLESHPGQSLLMLRMHGVDSCDLSGIEMLESTVKSYRELGGDVVVVRLRKPVEDVMDNTGFLERTLGLDHVLPQEGAIEYLFDHVLDPVVCSYECEHRVFAECYGIEKHQYAIQIPSSVRRGLLFERHLDVGRFQEMAARDDALIIDVREPEEYRRGHLPNARLLPLRRLLQEAPDLPRDRTLLLACRSGRRTARAMHVLLGMELDNSWGLRGGILAWRAEGLPVSMSAQDETEQQIGEPE